MNRVWSSISLSTILLCGIATAVIAAQAPPMQVKPIAATAVKAGAYTVEPLHTRVQFTVSHMGFTDWYGDFTGVSGSLQLDPAMPSRSKVDITIPAASIVTTSSKLDGELRDAKWLGTNTYPEIHFVSERISLRGPDTAKIYGALTFHGVTKPIVLDASFHGAGVNPLDKSYTVGFNAAGHLKRSDFGVGAFVPLIGDDVALRISAAFVRPN